MFKSVNPSTEEFLSSEKYISNEQLDDLVKTAHNGYDFLRSTSLNERCSAINSLANLLERSKKQFAECITSEIGKPINQSYSELDKCISLCKHYIEASNDYLADTILDEGKAKIIYKPLGVIVGVMPWNFPFWQVFRFAVPAILSGNSVIIKHSPNSGMCAELINDLFKEIELLQSSYFNAIISISQLADLLSYNKVKGASLTGSNEAGSSLGKLTGELVKPTVLELGGSDAFIVCGDINVESIIDQVVQSRLQNNGQSCIAGKRFFVPETLMERFKKEIVFKLSFIKIGDPKDDEIHLGPLARKDLLIGFNELLKQGEEIGAKLIYKKNHQMVKGYYADLSVYETTNENPLAQKEVFGPCFVLIPYKTKEECLNWVNNSEFGLSSSVWTNDQKLQEYYVNGIESGAVFINKISSSDPRFPFGGVKNSGVGKELGEHGIKSFVNQKLVVFD